MDIYPSIMVSLWSNVFFLKKNFLNCLGGTEICERIRTMHRTMIPKFRRINGNIVSIIKEKCGTSPKLGIGKVGH